MHETRFEAAVKVIQSLPKNGTCAGPRLETPPAESPEAPAYLFSLFGSSVVYLAYFFFPCRSHVVEEELLNMN